MCIRDSLQALEEFRFKTSLIAEPVVVEDDKLARAIATVTTASDTTMSSMDTSGSDGIDFTMDDGSPEALEDDTAEIDDAPVVRYIQKIFIDAINALSLIHI